LSLFTIDGVKRRATLAANTFQIETISHYHPEHIRSAQCKLREGSLAGQLQILRCAQDDTPASASVDSQHVFFEMY